MRSIIVIGVIWGLAALAVANDTTDLTRYESRPLPKVSAGLQDPLAPAKDPACVVPETRSWADVSVSSLARGTRTPCGAPLKASAGTDAEAATVRR